MTLTVSSNNSNYTGIEFTRLATGLEHLLALDSSGAVWAWGSNRYGQCGLGPALRRVDQLTRVPLPPSVGAVKSLCCGWNHSLILTAVGHVLACGSNAFGQCGVPDGSSSRMSIVAVPTRLTAWDGLRADPAVGVIAQVSAGAWHSLFLTVDGDIYSCGGGQHGQLGHAYPLRNPSGGQLSELSEAVHPLGAIPPLLAGGCCVGSEAAPRFIEGGLPSSELDPAVSISARAKSSSAVTKSGIEFVWGQACLPVVDEATGEARVQRYTPLPTVTKVARAAGQQ